MCLTILFYLLFFVRACMCVLELHDLNSVMDQDEQEGLMVQLAFMRTN